MFVTLALVVIFSLSLDLRNPPYFNYSYQNRSDVFFFFPLAFPVI